MKQALNLILGYLTCTDPVMVTKWENILASFWHKDEGSVVKTIAANGDDIDLTTLDGDGNETVTTIVQYQEPNFFDISKINGLEDIMGDKVDKVPGKGLSTQDFTTVLRQKLEGLANYVKPDSEGIGYIDGLQELLDQLQDNINQLNQTLADSAQFQFIVIDGYRTYKAAGNTSNATHEAGDVGEGRGAYAGGDFIRFEVAAAATPTEPIQLNILIQQA